MGIIYGAPLAIGGKKLSQLNVTTNGTWSKLEGYSPVNVNIPASAVTAGTKTISNNGLTNVIEYQNANVSVPASAVTAGTKTISNNGLTNVIEYQNANVSVPASAATAGTINISNNGLTNVIEYQNANVSVPASAVTSGTKFIAADGTYDVTELKNVRVMIGKSFVSASPVYGITYINGLPNNWNTMKEVAKMISYASGMFDANTTGPIYVNNGKTWAYKITPGNTINVTSQIGTYTYAVMGFNNFALTNQNHYGRTLTTAGLTFGAVKCVGEYKMNNDIINSGGWGNCLMRTSTMPTLQSGMPATLAQVKVPYVDYDNQSVVLYSDDYMFLPAEKEVFGARTNSPTAEANALTQFAYYKNGGSKIKYLNGHETSWWLRSVYSSHNYSFCSVSYGGLADSGTASFTAGTAPCFCV